MRNKDAVTFLSMWYGLRVGPIEVIKFLLNKGVFVVWVSALHFIFNCEILYTSVDVVCGYG